MFEIETGHIPDAPDIDTSNLISDLEEEARNTTIDIEPDEVVANIGGNGPKIKAKIPHWLSETIIIIMAVAVVAKALGLW